MKKKIHNAGHRGKAKKALAAAGGPLELIPPQITSILPGIVYQVINYPDGSRKCQFVNDTLKTITGLTPETLRQDVSAFDALIHPSDRERIKRAAREHNLNLRPWTQQYRLLLPQRGTRWIQSVAHLDRLSDGSVLWTGFITDVSSIKQAEEALQLSEERIALAARAGKVGLWDYDFKTHEIIWNETQYEIHGVSPESYKPNLENNSRFIHPDSRADVEAAFEQCQASGDHEYEVECQIVRADGEVRITRSNAFIIRDEKGEPIRAVGTEVDITEERRVLDTQARARAAAEAATQAKSEFLARMSHEIRTPMNAIVAPAEILADSDLPQAQRELALMIVNAGEHLVQIINDILDFSKLEAGKMRLVSKRFFLPGLVEEIVGLMAILAEKKRLRLRATISPAARRHWVGDAGRIKQILFNFLSNAIKFTETGEVCLSISVERRRKTQCDLRFVVRDTGVGLTKEDQKLLFHPFEQARRLQKNYQSGTGLGLAICRDLVEIMGGTLGAESAVEVGSSFWFSIPLSPGEDLPNQTPPSAHLKARAVPKYRTARILVAEDNASNRRVISLLLNQLGYRSDHAANGVQAIEKFRTENFDLILMDYEMPVMNGIAAAREIRRLELPDQHVPIIALTAHVSAEYRAACREAGMDAVLSKPIIMGDLKRTLTTWLRKSSSH